MRLMDILVVDDHDLFREGLKYLLRKLDESVSVREADNIDAAVSLMTRFKFDLILLDLNLPLITPLQAVERVRSAAQGTPVVALSGETSPELIRTVVDEGCMGFIPKSVSHSVLIQALLLVVAGGVYLPVNVLSVKQESATESFSCTDLRHLTDRQLETLRCVIEGKPNKLIAKQMKVTEHTVKAHLSAVFKTLKVKNRTEAVYVAASLGVPLPSR